MRFQRHNQTALVVLVTVGALATAGCTSPWFGGNRDASTPSEIEKRRESIRLKLESDSRPHIIGQIASERLLNLSRLENVGLVTSLNGTGGVVSASQPREKMLSEMRRNEVEDPNRLLDDPSTAMVVAFANVPPGAQKGENVDVLVKLSAHAEASDLSYGWLLETPLVEMSRLGGRVRESFDFAKASGAIVTRAQAIGSNEAADKLEGVIVGGGKLLKSRDVAIAVNDDYADAITMAAILPAINQRFTHFNGHKQIGIARPADDHFITLAIPPRYKHDLFHFVNVVLHIGFNETSEQLSARKSLLEQQLMEPTTVRSACWQLEAIGKSTVDMLAMQLNNPSREIQFYVAQSLAYLEDDRAIPTLLKLCKQEPAFRASSLNALTALDSLAAEAALDELLHNAEAETRYGALLALRKRNPSDPRVVGQPIGESMFLLEVPTSGVPTVCVSLHETPEIVIFGENPVVSLPEFHYLDTNTILRLTPKGTVLLNRFSKQGEEVQVETTTDLRSLLIGLVELGGRYGDCVSFLQQCQQNGYLMEPIALNPIPATGRVFDREAETSLMNIVQPSISPEAVPAEAESSWLSGFNWFQQAP